VLPFFPVSCITDVSLQMNIMSTAAVALLCELAARRPMVPEGWLAGKKVPAAA
jgi:hypothetical protein